MCVPVGSFSIWHVPVGPIVTDPWRLQFIIKVLARMYLQGPSVSDLWDPMTYMSHVHVGPFSISIRPVGPNDLCVMCTCGTIRPMGCSRVRCTCGTFLHLHPTCGTWRLVPFVPSGSNKFKKTSMPGVEPGTLRMECRVFTIALDA
jgi:hypothetical protein